MLESFTADKRILPTIFCRDLPVIELPNSLDSKMALVNFLLFGNPFVLILERSETKKWFKTGIPTQLVIFCLCQFDPVHVCVCVDHLLANWFNHVVKSLHTKNKIT